MHGALFHAEGITCLDVHHDGSVVITGGQDGAVRVTNIHNSRIVASLIGAKGLAGCGLQDGVVKQLGNICQIPAISASVLLQVVYKLEAGTGASHVACVQLLVPALCSVVPLFQSLLSCASTCLQPLHSLGSVGWSVWYSII
jgi:hypothetical protein